MGINQFKNKLINKSELKLIKQLNSHWENIQYEL